MSSQLPACRLCGGGVLDIGGYLHRVNATGVPGVWECRPSCAADLSQEAKLMAAIEGDGTSDTHGTVEVLKEDASNYSKILRILGMEEEGDPVAEVAGMKARCEAPGGAPSE